MWVGVIMLTTSVWAQTPSSGINTFNPDNSAVLDITATDKGVLLPRVALTALNDQSTVTNPAHSLLVYNTATAGTSPNAVQPGFYYYNNTGNPATSAWVPLNLDNAFWIDETTHITAATALLPEYTTTKVHIEPAGAISLDGNALQDGFSTLVINHSNASSSISFSNFTAVFDLNTAKANITANGSFSLDYLESAILSITERGGNKYLNINRFGGSPVTAIWDTDQDTGIQLEATSDDDIVRFYTAGTEQFRMNGATLETVNSGNSVFIGEGAGANDDLSDNQNVFVGSFAGSANTSGNQNTALGRGALSSLTSGGNNIAIGHNAQVVDNPGSNQLNLGDKFTVDNDQVYKIDGLTVGDKGGANSTGARNTIYGINALASNTSGYNNSAIGQNVLYNNTTGYQNIANGYLALFSNTGGQRNTAIGYRALYANTTGYYNTAMGNDALSSNVTGTNNTAIGDSALNLNTTAPDNVVMGVNAAYNYRGGTCSDGLSTSLSACNAAGGTWNNDFGRNTAIGRAAMSLLLSGSNNIAIGYNAQLALNTGSNQLNIGDKFTVDNNQVYKIDGLTVGDKGGANSTGAKNTVYGFETLLNNTSGINNTATGYQALKANTIGNDNTAMGYHAGLYTNAGGDLTTTTNSVFLGNDTRANADNETNQIVVGHGARGNGSNSIRLGNTSISYAGVQVAWTITSDQSLKENVTSSPLGLDFVKSLKPVSYTRKNDSSGQREYGLIAQELEASLMSFGENNTGFISTDSESIMSVRYNDLLAPMIKAIQQQQNIIDHQNNEISTLKSHNETLAARLEKLEAAVGILE